MSLSFRPCPPCRFFPPFRPCRPDVVVVLALLGSLFPGSTSHGDGVGIVVITEIMYHPRGGGQDREYVELYNATPAPIDLSGWFFSRGISFTFPAGTWLDGNTYLLVAADAERIREAYGIENVVGDWASCDAGGRGSGCALDNGGETLELAEHNGVVHARVRYNDRGRWPAGADGTGHSLEMVSPYREQDDPGSWLISGDRGGSPGGPNNAADRAAKRPPVRINEALLLTNGERWLELFNLSETVELDVSGLFLTDERQNLAKSRIPDGTTIAPGGWLTFTESQLGLDFTPVAEDAASPPRLFLALATADATQVIDAYSFRPEVEGTTEARFPDGTEDVSDRAEPTPGAANRVSVERNVVINELMYHPIDDNPADEFIELFNRGARPVDLTGWRISGGIDFRFADGQTIGPGEYLVVARNPATIEEVHGLSDAQVVGPDADDEDAIQDFGSLRDDGERINLRDSNDEIADTVRYHDGGDWPFWSDGSGSSLELVDPWQDNSAAAAWDSSDDSHKAVVQEFEYTGRYGRTEPELHIVLLNRGIALIDDLAVFQRVRELRSIETIVEVGEEWRYFRGIGPPSPSPEEWRRLDFDDSSWLEGPTPIGYGEDDEGTLLDDMRGSYVSVFFRKAFTVVDREAVRDLVLDIEYDDGYIAYLNGTRLGEGNVRPGQDAFDSPARSSRDRLETVDLTEFRHLLVEGENVLAVQVHNFTITSNDFRFVARLTNGEFVTSDGPNRIENGGFEDDVDLAHGAPTRPGSWLIEGTHIHSGRTTERPISGNASLKIVATGKGDNKANRLELTLPPLVERSEYVISFKARWVVGSMSLLTHGHEAEFPRSHALLVPRNLGTPGAANSATRRRNPEPGAVDTGPVIDRVEQEPPLPRAGEPVEISARVSDPDGVREVKVLWSVGSPQPPDSGSVAEAGMEGPDARGRYRVTIPGQAARESVVYSIHARDGGGRTSRYPVSQLDRAHPRVLDPRSPDLIDHRFLVYRHDDPLPSPHPSYRLWMHRLNEAYLSGRRLHSNDLVDATFLFEGRDLYYGARTRFSGSPFARSRWNESFRVAMAKDRPLHGAIEKFNMEDHQGGGGRDGRERISNYLIRHNQGNIKVPFSYQWLVQWQVNDRVNDVREHVQTPNVELIQRWYPGDDDGSFFEMDDRHWLSDRGSRIGHQDGRLTYPPYLSRGTSLDLEPDDPELYRWYFNLRMNEDRNDFSHLIELARVLTPQVTSDRQFDAVIWDIVDVEEFLRVWAVRLNTDDWDSWGARRGKNCYLYRPRHDGRWVLLPWDMELTYGSVSSFPVPRIDRPYRSQFSEVARLINRPRVKRLFYGILKEMVDHQFRSDFLSGYRTRLAARGVSNTQIMSPGGFIDQRRGRLLDEALAGATFPDKRLEVKTNSGEPLTTERVVVLVEGEAPVEITTILVTVNGRPPPAGVAVTFSTSDVFGWGVRVPLSQGANELSFDGFNAAGDLVDSASLRVNVSEAVFVRGDADLSGDLDIADAVTVLFGLFRGRALPCGDAADSDDSGGVDLTDAVALLDYLFRQGPPPVAPFPEPGRDPTPDALACERGLQARGGL